ncbi:MAG: CotH kinase family protein [Phycisphaerales bacterium JB063]
MEKLSACERDLNPTPLEVLEPRLLFTAVPIITELLASNDGGLLDEDGDSSDWLEIYNAGDSALDLTGWFLTDAVNDLTQWAFPSVSLGAGEYLVVFASNKDRADSDGTELHTNFALGAGGEYLALVEADGSTVAFEFAPEFPAQQTDVSYGFTASTSQSLTLVDGSTPLSYLLPTNGALGTAWTQAGFNDASWTSGVSGIGYENNPGLDTSYAPLISTTLPSGTDSAYARYEFNLADPSAFNQLTLRAMYDDGFVAYLNGTLVTSQNAPGLPLFDSSATGGRGDDVVLDGFVDFSISNHLGALQSGTNVLAVHALNQPNGSDMLFIPELIAEAFTVNTGDPGYFAVPTPGQSNGESFDGFVGDTVFSVDRGFYDAPFMLEITTPDTPDALIVYTTDGSAPSVDGALNIINGTAYTGPINIDSTTNIRAAGFKLGFEPTNVDTQTYLFLDDIAQQTAASQQAALEVGLPSGAGNGVDFGLDPGILNSFSTQAFRDSLLSIPTVSLTLDNAAFLGSGGIYSNPTQTGRASEREVSVEWFTPDGSAEFQVNAGVRIQGAASRTLAEKYSFRLAFRGDYGDPELVYPLFGEGVDEFDSIVLRSVFNDGYGWRGDNNNLREQLYVRDLWFRESQLAMGQPAARGNWAHLYINGQYWGLYHPSERPDADFAAETLGGDNDDYDAINHGGVIDDASENNPNDSTSANQIYATAISLAEDVVDASGSAAQWAAYQRLQGNFANGQDDPSQEDFLDVENYIDYMILNIFGGNDDWPNNNWFANRLRGADSEGFRFYSWDSEISLGLSTRTDVNENFTGVSGGAAELYSILRNYEEFRVQFSDRVQMHLFNGGALSGDLPAERFEALASVIRDAIIGESARWGDQHFSNNPLTQAEWDAALSDMLGSYFELRPGIVINQLIGANLYASVEPVAWNQRGGLVSPTFDIVLTAPQGAIYYTTDGSDPRLVGGGINPTATLYTGAINQATTGTIRARVLHNGEWSALDQAEFVSTVPTPEQEHLRIVELHYNPQGPNASELAAGFTDGDQFEFIELLNTSTSETIDLAGVSFTNGVGDAVFVGQSTSILGASFEGGSGGFSFTDNAFNGTNEVGVASGQRDATGGNGGGAALRVDLASADSGPDHGPSSGAYQRAISIPTAGEVTISFDYRLLFGGGFEDDEVGQVIAEFDGVRLGSAPDGAINAFTGVGNSGSAFDTGWRNFSITLDLSAGIHTFALGAYYNKSTLDNEGVTAWFDNVTVDASGPAPLAPGERALLVSDLAAFTERYGQAAVDSVAQVVQYTGNLANSGEHVTLVDANGSVILDFTYEDGNGTGEESWPTAPDGDGPSLIIVNTEGNYSSGNNWAASAIAGGTPGYGESAGLAGDINGDGFVGAADLDQLLAVWGDAAASSPEANAADLSGDGTVNSADLSIVIANWGNGAPPAQPTSNPDAGDATDGAPDDTGEAGAGGNTTSDGSQAMGTGSGDGGRPGLATGSRGPARGGSDSPMRPMSGRPARPGAESSAGGSVLAQRAAGERHGSDALALARPINTVSPKSDAPASPTRRFDALALGVGKPGGA